MSGAEGHDGVQHRLERFRHEGLQHVAFDRQIVDAGKFHDAPGGSGDGDRDLFRPDLAAAGGDTGHRLAFAQKAGDLAMLDDVDAAPVGGARISPRDGVMAGGAGARLQQPADDGKTRRSRHVEARHQPLDVLWPDDQFGVDTFVAHGVAAPGEIVELRRRMGQVDDPALGEHHIVVELVREVLPQFHRVLIEARIFRQQVV